MVMASTVSDFAAIVAAFVLVGVSGALIDVGGNTLVVWSRPPADAAEAGLSCL